MVAYLRAFVNFEQDDWAKFLPMAEFAYNNAKNASIGHMPFELNCKYHHQTSYKKDVNPCFQSQSANELVTELKEMIVAYRENLQHIQEV